MGANCGKASKQEAPSKQDAPSATAHDDLAISGGVRRDMNKVASVALDKAIEAGLKAGSKLPVVGGFIELLAQVKSSFEEIAKTHEGALEVAAWASQVTTVLHPIQTRLKKPGANGPTDGVMRLMIDKAVVQLKKLLSDAKHMSSGPKAASYFRSALFKDDFEAAKAVVLESLVTVNTAVAMDTNVTLHRVEDKVDKLKAMIAADETTDPETKEQLKDFVEGIQKQPGETRQFLVVVAEKIIVDGDGAGAIALLDTASETFRASWISLLLEGEAFKNQKKWTEAIAAYKKCVKLKPKNLMAWFQLGYAYEEISHGKSREVAIEPYQRCIELNPTCQPAYNNLGNIYAAVEDFESAEKMYRKAIELDPSDAHAHLNLGRVLAENLNDLEAAQEMLEKAFDLRMPNGMPNDMKSKEEREFFSEGCTLLDYILHTVRKDADGAEKMYRKAIELNPSSEAAFMVLGGLLEKKDPDEAALMHRKVIELDPNFNEGRIWWGLSECLENKNDIPGAIEATEEYIRLGNPDNDGEERLAALRAKL